MKLYLLTQNDNNDYDTYDSVLVCAKDEADARTIPPNGDVFEENQQWSGWAIKASSIDCEEIGKANNKQERGVIISSYNAG
jgi:hypothetical protein